MDVGFVELGVPQRPLDGVHGAAEQVGVQLFETSPRDTNKDGQQSSKEIYQKYFLVMRLVFLKNLWGNILLQF